jgi:hypothetical protein
MLAAVSLFAVQYAIHCILGHYLDGRIRWYAYALIAAAHAAIAALVYGVIA